MAPPIRTENMAKSFLYSFKMMVIINVIKPNTYNFNDFHYKSNTVLTVSKSSLISLITMVSTITIPAKVVIIA